MPFVSTGELAQLRADALKALADETCTILTPTTTVNVIGERVTAWGTVSTSVACRIRPAGVVANRQPTAQQLAGQEIVIAQWEITLPIGTTIGTGDRVVIDTLIYEVLQVWSAATWATACRVDARRLET